eukprot:GHVN01018890.1.p1 GENE.GHVN01018890.1~~GHVN01018890.1.p1  ORF type:complete len:112 (-),score=6.13 GHVN01018890.1:215-550(-)
MREMVLAERFQLNLFKKKAEPSLCRLGEKGHRFDVPHIAVKEAILKGATASHKIEFLWMDHLFIIEDRLAMGVRCGAVLARIATNEHSTTRIATTRNGYLGNYFSNRRFLW